MAKRFILPESAYYPLATLFLLGALGGLWITWQGQVENYRAGRAIDQVLRLIGNARDMGVRSDADPDVVQKILVDAFSTAEGVEKRTRRDVNDPGRVLWELVNPWGGRLGVTFYPSVRAVRFENMLTAYRCRRFLDFYRKDPAGIGLLRLDVTRDPSFAPWASVYEQGKPPSSASSKELCATGLNATVSLTFTLVREP